MDVAGGFDAVIVDQFGVLHDGRAAYRGAAEALAALRAAGLRVGLLSNSGKRAAANVERLTRLGFPPALYDAFVSSGEVAWEMLRAGALARPGARCLIVSRGGDDAVAGAGLELVEEARGAEVVVIAGSEGERVPLDAYRERLRPAAERGVPAVCTNPDRLMLTEAGVRFGAGAIAEAYAAMGGPVTWIGKPHPAVYHALGRLLGATDWSRCLGVGDSRGHDVAGIRGVGGRALLVETGLGGAEGDGPEPDYVAAALAP